jgi:hypothetical protein
MSRKAKKTSIFLTKIARLKASRVLKAHLGIMGQKSAYAKVLGSWRKSLVNLSIGFSLLKRYWIISSFKRFIQVSSTQGPSSWVSQGSPGVSLRPHASRFRSRLRWMLWCGLAFFILVWVLCFFLNSEAFDRYLVFESLEAYREGITRGKGAIHWIVDERQVSIAVSALDLIKHPRVLMSFQACAKALKLGALQALCFSLLCLAFLGIYAYRSRQRQIKAEKD